MRLARESTDALTIQYARLLEGRPNLLHTPDHISPQSFQHEDVKARTVSGADGSCGELICISARSLLGRALASGGSR